MAKPSFIPQVQVLRGSNVPSERQSDNVNQALQQMSPIVDSVSVAGITLQISNLLPAMTTVRNPLGRVALGMIATLKNQPCSIDLISSTANTAVVAISQVPMTQGGIIYKLSPLVAPLVVTLLFY